MICCSRERGFWQKKKDIDIKNSDGDTALHIALSKGSNLIVEALLNGGASVSILNNRNQSSSSYSYFNKNISHTIKLLISRRWKEEIDQSLEQSNNCIIM